MYYEMATVAALVAASMLAGLILGVLLSRWAVRRVRPRTMEAPVPVTDLGYDPKNPMNAGRGRETVQEGGATWYVISPGTRAR